MRVLMQIRDNYLACPGGDSIQLLKTKEYLEKAGVEVDVSTDCEPDLSSYDLVHLFNLTRIQETYIETKNAVKQHKPIALSTIYWSATEMNAKQHNSFRKFFYKVFGERIYENLKTWYRFLFKGQRNKGCRKLLFGNFKKMQKYVLSNSTICLPNSSLEMDELKKNLGIVKPYVVVPNAIDEDACKKALAATDFHEFDQYKDYLICVARISERKNQIQLLKALEGTDYKILFVGKSSPGEMKYFERFKEELKKNPNASYIESIENSKLYQLYKVCKVSVLISWFETPGLVSLEAASMGCNIVITDKGTTKDYFKDYAYYCDIDNLDEIRSAIEKAYATPSNPELQKMVLEKYTWNEAAMATIEGYKKIVPSKENV